MMTDEKNLVEAGAVADAAAKKRSWKCLLGFHDDNMQIGIDANYFILTCKRCGKLEFYH